MHHLRTPKTFLLIAIFTISIVASACAGTPVETTLPGETPEATQAPDTTEAADTTEAPETTEAPDTTVAPEDGDEASPPWWILILLGIALILLIVAFASRGKKAPVVGTVVAATWKDHARTGYAESRHLYDSMGEDMAVWRGNAQFESATSVGDTAATSKAETWGQLAASISKASDSLYALEAAAPDPRTAESARATVTTMLAVRGSLDARAEARFAYRTAEAEPAQEAATLSEARDREIRASRNLVESRNEFALALTNLSTIV
jgi:hypothetical protein